MKDEALKLALVVEDFDNNDESLPLELLKPIAATLRALAQPEQEPVAHCEAGPEYCPVCRAETRSLALAAAVGYIQRNTPTLVWTEICNALTTTPPAQPPQRTKQEPVAWRTYTGRGYYIIDPTFEDAQKNWPDKQHQPLYTSPPQRTWVSLSDEDRNDCLVEADPCECLAEPEAQELMRCVEAKSRSKNQ